MNKRSSKTLSSCKLSMNGSFFSPATFMYLSQTRTCITISIGHGHVCVHWLELRCCVCFIGGIVDHHCINFFFIINLFFHFVAAVNIYISGMWWSHSTRWELDLMPSAQMAHWLSICCLPSRGKYLRPMKDDLQQYINYTIMSDKWCHRCSDIDWHWNVWNA